MSLESNKRLIQRFAEECINRQNYSLLDTITPENFIEHVPFPGQGPGREGLKDILKVFHRGFPDLRWTIHEQIAEGDTVVSRFTFTATHRGEFLGLPPTNRRIEVWGIVIDVIKNNLFTESRILMDSAGMMQQLQG